MATFAEYESFDGLGLASLVKKKIVSADELLDAAFERVEERNPRLNAVIHTFYDQARSLIPHHTTGTFAGVPFLLKDLFADYAHQPSTSGCAYTRHYVPEQDGELVKRFKAGGLIIFGKTNVPEFGLSPTTESTLLGAAHNPWDLARTPGGSSGGSAAAVAAGIVPMAHGNDGGGSLRIPAAYCGLFGFKPSRGRTAGGSPSMRAWEAMVVEHVLTRSVRDSAAMLDVIAGPHIESPHSLSLDAGSYLASLDAPLKPLKIGILETPFFPSHIDEEVTSSLHQAAILCQSLGHSVTDVTLKINSSDIAMAYLIVLAHEMNATLARIASLSGRKVTREQLELETYALFQVGSIIKSDDIAWAVETLTQAAHTMTLYFNDFDILMSPTMPTVAPLLGKTGLNRVEQGILRMLTYLPGQAILRKAMELGAKKSFAAIPYTPIFNISGQPAMSVPLCWDKTGLPIGIQFAAGLAAEKTLFQLAHQLEEAAPWFEKRAPLFLA